MEAKLRQCIYLRVSLTDKLICLLNAIDKMTKNISASKMLKENDVKHPISDDLFKSMKSALAAFEI